MTNAAARIFVDDVHEFPNRVLAVADHVAGLAFCCRNKLSIDHEQAVIEAFNVGLDDDRAAVLPRFLVGHLDFLLGLEVGRDTAAMIAGQRL